MTPPLSLRPILRALLSIALLCLFVASVPADEAPPAIRIVTEELPPYNMTRDGKLTGMSTEVVQAVLKHIGVRAGIQSMPWARAYDLALNGENILIYSIARSAEREGSFKWVGTVAPSRWYLFSYMNHPVTLQQLEDAKRFQIATVNEDVGEQYLISNQFAIGVQLQSSNRYELNYEKLKLGHVDLWISNERNARYLVRKAGDNPADVLVPSLRLEALEASGGLSMAFSRRTPDATVQLFQQGLQAIRDDGTYDAIARKWN
jgi:polar amino acid transport system substrate-binding protein